MADGSEWRTRRIGREGRALVTADGFSPDPSALRAAAAAARFEPAPHHYPGLRAPLPPSYLQEATPAIERAARLVSARDGPVRVVDAGFAIVTAAPAKLTVRQRLPHCDAFDAGRVAMVHHLSPDARDGTAFFRHRSTGFETVDGTRAPVFFGQLDAELRHGGPPPAAYIAGDTPLFERIALAEAAFDRAHFYPSFSLHSGAIAPGAALPPDPMVGRLTITAFLLVG